MQKRPVAHVLLFYGHTAKHLLEEDGNCAICKTVILSAGIRITGNHPGLHSPTSSPNSTGQS